MRRFAFAFLLLTFVGNQWFSPELDAAKKQDKTIPVKIVKASDTKFKHAKLVQPKQQVKKKRFLWFKKKEVNRLEPKKARLNGALKKPAVVKPESKDIPVIEPETVPAK
ncbi:hypothetical protein [Pelagicoccus mobilis]|uniref:Uncharacterized protein n=1 Tax=Pelagicoccus mobilis TaxID=415221 RepID=A0A934S0N0_9BACT|nr:hypothetical protein [Pelagicoccus mobilis]MBK1878386.1 hypothetical protein [Pelagicoccus mobilis]